MHPDDLTLQMYRDGEADAVTAARLREHLAACDGCRTRVEHAGREEADVDGLLRALDTAPPRVDLRSVVARSRARRKPVFRRAAVIAFLLGSAAVAYGLPGSPLRSWLGAGSDGPELPPANDTQADAGVSGLTVAPGERLVIVFAVDQRAGTISVSLIDGDEASIRAPAGAATFTSNAERLEIGNRGSASSFEILLPRDAPDVEIRIADRTVLRKQAERIISDYSADAGGLVSIPLTAPPR